VETSPPDGCNARRLRAPHKPVDDAALVMQCTRDRIIQAVEKPPFPARGIVWPDSLM